MKRVWYAVCMQLNQSIIYILVLFSSLSLVWIKGLPDIIPRVCIAHRTCIAGTAFRWTFLQKNSHCFREREKSARKLDRNCWKKNWQHGECTFNQVLIIFVCCCCCPHSTAIVHVFIDSSIICKLKSELKQKLHGIE